MPSSAYTAASHAQFPGVTPIHLVTVTVGTTSPTILRLCTNSVDFVSRGDTFTAAGDAMTVQLYEDREDRPPRARLAFENLTGEMMEAVRSLDPLEPTTVLVELVTSEEPDVVQDSWDGAELRDITYTSLTIEGELTAENVVGIAAPAMSFDPVNFPALHAGVP